MINDAPSLTAQAKAAAWALVALLGANRAVNILQGIITEITNSQWSDPHGGDR